MAVSGYALASQAQVNQAYPHPHRHWLVWLIMGGIAAAAVLILGLIAASLQPTPVTCPHGCPTPPPPVVRVTPPAHTFTSSAYGFSLQYWVDGLTPSTDDASISWDGTLRSTGQEVTWTFAGERTRGRGPEQIVQDLQSSKFGDAQPAYTIPGAEIGYQPGYGEVYDMEVTPPTGEAYRARVIITAAEQGNLAIETYAAGPYQQDKEYHPNPVSTFPYMVDQLDSTGNSVTWPGETPL